MPTLFPTKKKSCGYTQGLMMRKENQTYFLSIILGSAALLLAQCIFMYGDTGRDDAFFTYWSAQTLAEHGHILNYNGEHVEQSSTLLYTLLLAACHKITPFMAIPTLSLVLSLAAGFFTLLASACILRQQKINPAHILILTAAPSMVFWSCSGMETLVSTALFTIILFLCLQDNPTKKQLGRLAVVAALAVLNRPETFIVLFCFGLLAWLLQRKNHTQWIILLLTTVAAAGLAGLWRHYYFNDWFPQPVTAKSSREFLWNILKGINYIIDAGDSITTQCITAAGLFSWFAALMYWKHPLRLPVLVSGSLALAQLAFIIATGGDWMEASRFLLPVLPALLLCVCFFLTPWKIFSRSVFALLFFVALYDSWYFAHTRSTGLSTLDQTAAIQRYIPDTIETQSYSQAELHTKDALRDIPQLEHLNSLMSQLATYPEKLNIASIQMGFIPYHLGKNFPERLHFLDLRALSTRDLSGCPLLNKFPRTETGIKISYDEFFALLPVLNRQCGIAKPDILYDLGYDMRQNVLQDNGYVITYLEKRGIRGDFSTRQLGSELFVAVRRELAAQYKLKDIAGNVPTTTATPANNPPNIVFLIADDISYDNFGFMGNAAARTPTLDQLAQQGTVFTTGYVPSAFCRPSLATLLTGQWPHQNHVQANNGAIGLPRGSVTLATRLQQHGYATFSGGKFWEQEPDLRGFDSFDTDRDRFARKNQDALWQFLDQYAGNKPFFIWWAPMLPHTPHNPPQEFLDAIDANAISIQPGMPADKQQEFREKEKVLLAMNLWFDSEAKKLQEKLKEKGQIDNTLFVFMSDNGQTYRTYSKNTPYELGLRTPMIFSWPGHIPAQRIDAQTSSIHMYNTLLDFAGIPALAGTEQSHSLKPVIEKQLPPVSEKQFGADYQSYTERTEADRTSRPERDIYALHIRDGEWKYIFYLRDLREKDNIVLTIQSGMSNFPARNAGDEELYYLPTDQYEETNLAAQQTQQKRIENYRREALQWWYSTGGKPLDASIHCPAQPVALCQKLDAIKAR
ncbi:MAG TPA: sulfatase-like hydrolase/transferase [Pseudomonadales bacterium]|nr:sulfatase-like hydrolase/transferase [Pseudomonadales bacterium]